MDAQAGDRDGAPEAPWVETDRLEAHLVAASATEVQTKAALALARDGYAVLDFDDPSVPDLCDRAVADLRPYHEDDRVSRIQDAWTVSPAVRALADHAEVRDFLRLAYGRAPFPFQTLNFEWGSQQHVHSDTIHFHSLPPKFMCGVWFALEDVAEDAGPLIYYPGSHQLPVVTMRDVGVNDPHPTPEHYQRRYVPAFARLLDEAGLSARPAVLKKGQALVWAANLAHGGAPIRRPGATRRSLVTHYFFEGCAYYTPMTSSPETGSLSLRVPLDVARRALRWPTRGGMPLWPGGKALFSALRQRVLPRPIVYRDRG